MSLELFIPFLLASFLICLAPGPDNIFVLMLSALHGKKYGLLVTMGLCTGLIVHTLIVSLGVASLLQSLPYSFAVISYIGSAYLAYLAWLSFKSSVDYPLIDSNNSINEKNDISTEAFALYLRGFFMNITNPKVTIFFMAFLPQFTKPDRGDLLAQFIILGFVFIVIALMVFSGIACMAGKLRALSNRSNMMQRYLNLVVGLVFVILSINLIMFGNTTL